MHEATINTAVAPGVINDTATGYLTNNANPAAAPQQFNIPVQVRGGSGRQGIYADTTSPYLGVFNR